VWTGLEHEAQKALAGINSYFGQLAPVSAQDRSEAQIAVSDAERAQDAGDLFRACAYLLRARACDPYDQAIKAQFDDMVTAASEAAKLADPMEGSRGFAIVTDAEYLLEDPKRLKSYAEVMRDVATASLIIDASRMDSEAGAAALTDLVSGCGLADDDDISLIGVLGELTSFQRFRLNSQSRARYGAIKGEASAANVPVFGEESLAMLRDQAAAAEPAARRHAPEAYA